MDLTVFFHGSEALLGLAEQAGVCRGLGALDGGVLFPVRAIEFTGAVAC